MRAVTKRLQTAGDGLRRALAPPAGRRQRALDRGARQGAERRGVDACRSTSRRSCARISSSGSTATIVTSATLTASRATSRRCAPLRLPRRAARPRRPGARADDGGVPVAVRRTRRSRCSRSRATSRRPTWTPTGIATRSRASCWTWPSRPTAACSCCSRAIATCAQLAAELRARGVERRWPLLVHGDESRDALLARFRDSGQAILLGTASFWEGVDVPGDALRGLRDREASVPRAHRAGDGGAVRGDRGARAATRSPSTCCRTPRCG